MEVLDESEVVLANHQKCKVKELDAVFEYDEGKKSLPVRTLPEGSEPLAGVVFLEAYNLEVDSANEQVVKSAKPAR